MNKKDLMIPLAGSRRLLIERQLEMKGAKTDRETATKWVDRWLATICKQGDHLVMIHELREIDKRIRAMNDG